MKPIEVVDIDGKLIIDQNAMQINKKYRFRFLDADMVAIRTKKGIDLYQEVDYVDRLVEGEEMDKKISNCPLTDEDIGIIISEKAEELHLIGRTITPLERFRAVAEKSYKAGEEAGVKKVVEWVNNNGFTSTANNDDTGEMTKQEKIREGIVIRLMAADEIMTIEEATDFWLTWKAELKKNPEHFGDCTKEPQPCNRCLIEDYYRRADEIIRCSD